MTLEDANWRIAEIMIYYTCTSLSTVGFGDYYPNNNYERCISSIVLFVGVVVFSYVLGTLCHILKDFQSMDEDLDQGDELNKFF